MIGIGICTAFIVFAFGFTLYCAWYLLCGVWLDVADEQPVKGTVPPGAAMDPLRHARSFLVGAGLDAPRREDA